MRARLATRPAGRDGHDRNFLRFWTGSTISAAGSALTTVAIPIVAVQQLSSTPAQMGVLFAAATAASLLIRLPAAAWADRSARRLGLVSRGQALSGMLIGVVPLLSILSALTYESLLIVVAALRATTAVVDAFAAPTVPLLVPSARLAAAYGRFTVSRSAADVAGPAFGGLLLQAVSAPLLFVGDALSFFVASLLTRSVRVAEPEGAGSETGPLRSPGHALWAVFRVPFLQGCLVVVAIASLANGATSALLVLFMVRQLGLDASAVGIVLGAGAVGGVLAGVLIGATHAWLGVARTAAVAGALMIASLAGLPLAQPGWTGLAACLVYELAGSLGAGLMVITIVSEIPRRIASGAIARGMAMANLVPEIAATVGALAGGALASATSVRLTLWSALFFAALAGLLMLIATRTTAIRGSSSDLERG